MSASPPTENDTAVRPQTGDSREVVTSGQSLDLSGVSERSTHDDGLVVVLLVVAAGRNMQYSR